jgi:hypothetical protein
MCSSLENPLLFFKVLERSAGARKAGRGRESGSGNGKRKGEGGKIGVADGALASNLHSQGALVKEHFRGRKIHGVKRAREGGEGAHLLEGEEGRE